MLLYLGAQVLGYFTLQYPWVEPGDPLWVVSPACKPALCKQQHRLAKPILTCMQLLLSLY
jgi:hypothetical protein